MENNNNLIESFLSFFPEFKSTLGQENSMYKNTFNIYYNIAKNTFSENIYFESTEFVRNLYVAHNLQMTFNRAKNINNNANLNTSIASVSKKDNIGGKEEKFRSSISEFYNSYAQTEYGIQLYSLIKNLEIINIVGVY